VLTKRFGCPAFWCFALLLFDAPPALAQQSLCAGCHVTRPEAPAPEHLSDWDHSAHGRNNVGCEKCHGGDPGTVESLLAHQGVLNSRNPASPVHRSNLPATCGACHASPFVAFQKSRHFALLQEGDRRGPVCSTCHGAVGSRRPSPRTLEARCGQCHGPDGIVPRSERAEAARTLYDSLHESRELMRTVRTLIDRVTDQPRRTELDEAYQQVDVPLIQAVEAGHAFVYDDLKERLSVARERLEALLGRLANPRP
jgi:hypothetical protein